MGRTLKDFVLNMCQSDFAQRVSAKVVGGKYIFLMYHGVTNSNACDGDWLQVPEHMFREQMQWLKDNYHVASLKDIMDGTNVRTNKTTVVITFDDGYANNCEVAYPILKELGLPATIFLVTSVIGTNTLYWYDKLFTSLSHSGVAEKSILEIIETFKKYHPHQVDDKVDEYIISNNLTVPEDAQRAYRVLTWGEIKTLYESKLITFGSHTHKHELLTMMSDEQVEETLRTSYNVISSLPGGLNAFCYPNGFHTNQHKEICRKVGYSVAVKADSDGGVWSPKFPDFGIPRWGIGSSMTLRHFKAVVSGTMHLLRKVRS